MSHLDSCVQPEVDIADMPRLYQLRENIFALSALQIINYSVPLVTVPYLTRVLGPAHFGLVCFAQALVLCFDVITDYGFNLSATRAVAAHRAEPAVLSRIFWSTMAAKALLMLCSVVVVATLVYSVPKLKETAMLYAVSFLAVIGTAFFPVWLFQGLEQMKFITIAQSSGRVLTVPVIFLLVRSSEDYVAAAAIQGSVLVWASLVCVPIIWVRLPIRWYCPHMPDLTAVFRGGWHVFLANLSSFLYSSASILLLGVFAGQTEVGYFSAADRSYGAVSSPLSPSFQALYPHLSALKDRSLESALRLIRRSLIWVGCCSLSISVAVYFLATQLGLVVFGESFAPAVTVLRCLSPLPMLYAFTGISVLLRCSFSDWTRT